MVQSSQSGRDLSTVVNDLPSNMVCLVLPHLLFYEIQLQ